jgi:thiol-disulfide isomerase/thioredoxin
MRKIFLFLALLFILLSYNISAKTLKESLSENGFAIPKKTVQLINFELKNLDGLTKQLTDYKGKVVLLNFWATWCGPCRIEMPSMDKLYKEFEKDGFELLAVNIGESSEIAGKFMKSNNLSFPVLLDEDQSVAASYGIRSIPTSFLIDKDGNILGMAVGAREWDSSSFRILFTELLK